MKTLLATTALLFAGLAQAQEFNDQARVLRSDPVYEQVSAPREECWVEYRDDNGRYQRRDSGDKLTGQIIGGVVGGLAGNQVGKGHGKEAATAAGAIAGVIIGGNIADRDDNRDGPREVRRCRTVQDQSERRLTGYDVTYEYQGQTYHSVLHNDPGRWLPVRVRLDVTPNAR